MNLRRWEKLKFLKESSKRLQNRELVGDPELTLCIVDEATLVKDPDVSENNSNYIWKYLVKHAWFDWAGHPNFPSITQRYAQTFDAFSISELGNLGTTPNRKYSYGIPETDLPTGIVPKKIPLGTPVLCWHIRNHSAGKHFYLIINTQAISGACP